jgi:Sec-independent protein translocase protein TatA
MPDLVIVLVVILILVLLWRGPKTLPQLGEALGRGVKEARTAARTDDDDPDAPRTPPPAQDDRRA